MRTEGDGERALAAWRRSLDEVRDVQRELVEARRQRDRPRVSTLTAAVRLLALRSDLLLANAVSIVREAERSDGPRRSERDPGGPGRARHESRPR